MRVALWKVYRQGRYSYDYKLLGYVIAAANNTLWADGRNYLVCCDIIDQWITTTSAPSGNCHGGKEET